MGKVFYVEFEMVLIKFHKNCSSKHGKLRCFPCLYPFKIVLDFLTIPMFETVNNMNILTLAGITGNTISVALIWFQNNLMIWDHFTDM